MKPEPWTLSKFLVAVGIAAAIVGLGTIAFAYGQTTTDATHGAIPTWAVICAVFGPVLAVGAGLPKR